MHFGSRRRPGWPVVVLLALAVFSPPPSEGQTPPGLPPPLEEGAGCPRGGRMTYTYPGAGGQGVCVHGMAFYGEKSDAPLYQGIVDVLSATLSSTTFRDPLFPRRSIRLVMYNDHDEGSSLDQLLSFGEVDIFVVSAMDAACLARSEFKAVSIASVAYHGAMPDGQRFAAVRERRPQGVQSAVAGLFVIRSEDRSMTSIEDIKGKIVATNVPHSEQGSRIQFREMVKHGVQPLVDPRMLVWCKDPRTALSMVADGLADVALVGAGMLNVLASEALVSPRNLKILDARQSATWAGAPFPHTTSTDVYPDLTVAARTGTERMLVDLVVSSLYKISGNSSALGNAMIHHFETPLRTSMYDGLLKDLVVMRGIDSESTSSVTNLTTASKCLDRADDSFGAMYQTLNCPPGHRKRSLYNAAQLCNNDVFKCPVRNGVIGCSCETCLPSQEFEIFAQDPAQGPNMYRRCKKNGWCGEGQQGLTRNIFVMDNRRGKVANVTWRIGSSQFGLLMKGKAIPCDEQGMCKSETQGMIHLFNLTFQGHDHSKAFVNDMPRRAKKIDHHQHQMDEFVELDSHAFCIELTTTEVRQVILEIFVDGVQMENSPVLHSVVPFVCEDKNKVADNEGRCICGSRGVAWQGGCIDLLHLLLGILVPIFVFVAIAWSVHVRRLVVRADQLWQIDGKEIRFRKPPEVLGKGSFGLVLQGTYRGTKVAVKRAVLSSAEFKLLAKKESPIAIAASEAEQPPGTADAGATAEEHLSAEGMPWSNKEGGVESHGGKSSLGRESRGNWSTGGVTASMLFTSEKFEGNRGFCNLFAQQDSSKNKEADRMKRLQADFQCEMRLLSKLRHPCILPIMGVVMDKGKQPMLVTELLEIGSLSALLKNESVVLGSDLMMPIIEDVAHGLLFLHGRSPPIVHADLKSANVLISSAFRAKVADFGLSVKQVTCGTPVSMAPELLRGGRPTTQSDVYAFGIVLYEIFARKGPYQAEIDGGMVRKVLSDVADLSMPSKLNISKIAPDQMVLLMQRCLCKTSTARPSFVDISKCLGEMGEVLFQIEYPHSVKRIVPGKATLNPSIPSHISTAILSGKMKYAGLFVGHLKPTCDGSEIFKLLGPGTTKMLVEAVQEVMQRALEEYNVQLVDTKTDSWLVISNMMEPQDDAAARIAYFALYVCSAVNQVAQNFGVDDKGFGFAGAISYGPVVAKILLSQSSRYCLFGEAVSEVFRLGQHTEYGHVLASHQTYRQLHFLGAVIQKSNYAVESNLQNSCWIISPPTEGVAPALKKSLSQFPGIGRRSSSLTKNQIMRRVLSDKSRDNNDKPDMLASRSFDAGAMAKRAVWMLELTGRHVARSVGGGTPPQYNTSPGMKRSSSAQEIVSLMPIEPLNCTSAQVLGKMDPVEEAWQGSGKFAVMSEDPNVMIAGVKIEDPAEQGSGAIMNLHELEVRVEGEGGDETGTRKMGAQAGGSEHDHAVGEDIKGVEAGGSEHDHAVGEDIKGVEAGGSEHDHAVGEDIKGVEAGGSEHDHAVGEDINGVEAGGSEHDHAVGEDINGVEAGGSEHEGGVSVSGADSSEPRADSA